MYLSSRCCRKVFNFFLFLCFWAKQAELYVVLLCSLFLFLFLLLYLFAFIILYCPVCVFFVGMCLWCVSRVLYVCCNVLWIMSVLVWCVPVALSPAFIQLFLVWPAAIIISWNTIETTKGLRVIHLNIRSLVSKTDELRAWVTHYKPNIITISETWLHSKITDESVEIDNFVLYRSDRASRGGGVATYVAANLVSECVILNEEPVNFESLFINITFHDNKHLIIGNI